MSIRNLPKQLKLIAEKELNEVPERTEDDINAIKNWLKVQKHLNVRLEDQLLISFLRGCKFSLERTKEKIDKYYTIRSIAPEFFSKRDPFISSIQYLLNKRIVTILPLKVGEPVRLLARFGALDLDFAELQDIPKIYFMLIDILLEEEDNCVISGSMSLIDLKGITLKHILQATIPLAQKTAIALESYPSRLKAIDYIHVPSIAMPICNVFKSLLPQKLNERCTFYEDDGGTAIFDNFPLDILPQEYGGQAGPLQNIADQWKLKLESYKDWFENEAKYGSDETKRQKDSKYSYFSNVCGINGSFRKLEID